MPVKKLIEAILPVQRINLEAETEKTARIGTPSNAHIWWTRTPLAISRGVLFASLVDDPSSHPEFFPTEDEQNEERKRLLYITDQLISASNNNDGILETAKKEIKKCFHEKLPVVYDPFVGGGSIPVEAHRLGLKSISSDVNVLAGTITTVVSDIPARFSDIGSVHPKEDVKNRTALLGTAGFAEDVYYYGKLIEKEAFNRIGYLYPNMVDPRSGEENQVSAWIWTRTIECPNPSCNCNIPLSSSYDLAKKKGSEVWIEPAVKNNRVNFIMHHGPRAESDNKPKVAQTAVFKCPACGEITPDSYVKESGVNHRIDSQLIAIVVDNARKRLYLEATGEQEKAADVEVPKAVAHGELPDFPKRFSPPAFGLTDYADLFTNRQLVFITTMLDLAKEVQAEIEIAAKGEGLLDDSISFADGGTGALAYAEAIRITLVLTVSKLLDRCSNLCSWSNSGGGSLRNVFSRAAMPMIWDYAESNPFAQAGGSWASALSRTCEAIKSLPAGVEGRTFVADAAIPIGVQDALISTDLPYYDRVAYQELSDFFYVWLKYGLGDLYSKLFSGAVSSKEDDMTAFSYRYDGDKQKADAVYYEKMQAVFRNLYNSATTECPSTIGYIYKRKDASNQEELSEWERFVSAVCDAGFTITASWPLGRKYDKSIEVSETRGIPITLVIRKKETDGRQITRRQFVASVKREIPSLLEDLSHGVEKMDLRPSVIGRALNIYTRNQLVIDADGSRMKPHMASRIIEQEIDTHIAEYYTNNDTVNEEEIYDGRES